MNKESILLLSTLSALCVNAQNKQELPNIVCIVAEDISPIIGCYGDAVAKTPHLDAFSKDAIRYNLFTSVGVSAPSRYSLITGRYPSCDGANNMRTGGKANRPADVPPYSAIPPTGVKCFTEYLREHGYYCTNNEKTDYQFATPITAWDECGRGAHWKNRPANTPFFSIFNIFVTHESQVWARANKPLSVDPKDIVVPPYYPDNDVVRGDMAVAYSNVTEMDRQFRGFVKQLEDAGEIDNTIIIWYADNGGPLPRQKRAIYESGMLVPFMIRYPDGYRKGEFDERLLAFVDVPATVLSLAGIKPPKNMHGVPFLGKYEGKERKYVFGARDRFDVYADKQGCVRDEQFRYVRNYNDGTVGYLPLPYRRKMPMMRNMEALFKAGKLNDVQSRWFAEIRGKEEFYDVKNDPHEINNLIDDPRYSKEISRLRKAYEKWDKQYHTYWHLTELENLDRIHPNGKTPKVEIPQLIRKKDEIIIKCATEGASIAYRIQGNDENWHLYTAPLKLTTGDKLETKACRIGYESSKSMVYLCD